jgi:hypothetical protein
VTVVVEEQVASGLSAAAEEKVRGWDHQQYGVQLLMLYRMAGKNLD